MKGVCIMRINPINSIGYYYSKPTNIRQKQTPVMDNQLSFQGKHSSAKFLGGICGALGTLGAIGGTIIMTGGVALPFVLGYGAMSAGTGAILGHIIDKGAKEADKELGIKDNK